MNEWNEMVMNEGLHLLSFQPNQNQHRYYEEYANTKSNSDYGIYK